MIPTLHGPALAFALALMAPPESRPLRVATAASPRPHYVGRAIELKVEVEVEAGQGSPKIEAPRSPDVDLYPMPLDPARPTMARFVAVPRRPGTFDLPPFQARSADRSGASRPTRLVVANVPAEGRSSAFLGGVGPLDVVAEAEPSDVRVGGTLEFRVKIAGEAAWGSVRAPDLSEWVSPTLKLESLPSSIQGDETPVRTFRYRVRPLRSGQVVLPPVAIAAFDPATRRYATKATSSVTIRVEAAPKFDPTRLAYPPAAGATRASRWVTFGAISAAVALASGLALASWSLARRRAKSRPPDPGKLAGELARDLKEGADAVEAARSVAHALTTFLHRASRRPMGVLTPQEAQACFGRLTGDPSLATVAGDLVGRCDRVLFGAAGRDASGLISEARGFLEGVAGAMAVMEGGGPGEAVETASEGGRAVENCLPSRTYRFNGPVTDTAKDIKSG